MLSPLLWISSLDTAVSDAVVAAANEAAAGLPGWWPADPTNAGWCGDGAPPCTAGPPADGGGGGGGAAYHGQPVCPLNMRSLSYTDSAAPPPTPPPPRPPPPPPGWWADEAWCSFCAAKFLSTRLMEDT